MKRFRGILSVLVLFQAVVIQPQPFGVLVCKAEEQETLQKEIAEPELTELDDSVEVPDISEEIDAILDGRSKELSVDAAGAEEEKTEELYRLLDNDPALSSYGDAAVESVYDPRKDNRVTPVRNQVSNTCWAFSSIAAGEESLVYKGLYDPASLDLSEAQLIYFFYHPVADPLGNTAGDGNYNLSSGSYLAVGSNTIFSTFALANWVGAAPEYLMPFEELDASDSYDASLAYADAAHLQNAYWINFKDVDAVNVVKQMVKQYGAAAINFYYNSKYYNSSANAYYFPLNSSQANNHSVTIVGWDDTYRKENFNAANRPLQDGAWIVKNSYGGEWGDGGYFYLSYEDSAVNVNNINGNRARAYIFDFESADNYDYNYQHDGSAGAFNATNSTSNLTKIASGGAIANVFDVQNKNNHHVETLKAVSFALFDTAVSYEIQVYKNLSDAADPTSGEPQLLNPVTGSTSYVGYYTIPLNQDILLEEGENFSVVVTLKKESQNQVEFFIDKTYQNGSWVSFVNQTESGESFRFINGGWEDLAENGATARIKAFTVEENNIVKAENISFTSDGITREADGSYCLDLWSDENYQMKVSVLPSNTTNQNLQWSTTNSSVVTVDKDGKLTPVGAGMAEIIVSTVDGSELSIRCKVTVKVRAESISLSASSLKLYVGDQVLVTALIKPENAEENRIIWESSNEKAASVKDDGTVEAVAEGNAVIHAYLETNPSIEGFCEVTVTEKEENVVNIKENPPNQKPSGQESPNHNQSNLPEGQQTAQPVKNIEQTGNVDTSDSSPQRILFWLLIFVLGANLVRTRKNLEG